MSASTNRISNGSVLAAIAFVVTIAALYFARQVLIPFALAILCAFLLNPAVKRLESLRVPRVPAVLIAMVVAFGVLGGIGWAVTDQLVGIINELPQYRANIDRKMAALRAPSGITRLVESVEDLGREITTTPANRPQAVAPRTPAKSARTNSILERATSPTASPVKVELVEPAPNALQSLRNVFGPLVNPLETAGIVVVFTLFMLIDREDLRNRVLRLLGQQQLHRTTKALDDAAHRVSRYLTMQILVNASLGAVIGVGLYFIGVPSFLLWGVLTIFLRFLPYVGILIAGTLPFSVAVATMEGWRGPLMVVVVFFAVELVTSNFIEPRLYGAHTGLSSLAVLGAIVFWTALWGPVGLILSTPLTVCLSVLGRYSPRLEFLNVLLGDEPVLTPDAVFYQRLLALDTHEALTIAENFLRENSLVELYDQMIAPTLSMAERDRHSGQLEARRERFIVQSINEIVTELGEEVKQAKPNPLQVLPLAAPEPVSSEKRLLCFSAHDQADEIAAAMLAQLGGREGFPALSFPYMDAPEELLAGLGAQPGDAVCISSVPPFAITHARRAAERVREAFPDVTLLVGLWGVPASPRTVERLSPAGAVVTNFADALQYLRASAKPEQALAPAK